MKSILYTHAGDPSVLHLTERPLPAVGDGEVRVKVAASRVNPTDWKVRQDRTPVPPYPTGGQVPNQDGAGTVDAIGDGVAGLRPGDRVWLWDAAWRRSEGTAQGVVGKVLIDVPS